MNVGDQDERASEPRGGTPTRVSSTRPKLCGGLGAAVLLLLLALAGCGQGGAASGTAATTETPRQTVQKIIDLRARRDYQQLRTLIVPAHASNVVTTLIAVDEFLAANDALCTLLRQEVGVGVAEMIDQSPVGSTLDIFSRYVELLDERVSGETATVGFLINHELPARDARLVRDGAVWRYDPGEGFDPALPDAFRKMAAGLRDTADAFRDGRVRPDDIRADPEKLVSEVMLRMSAGVRMLPAAGERKK
ncbi:hypothetical protein RAS1_07010 [Phycisphaerae bacterium RAS1]|nr:hypothetical protein RAS1_07010 [Phycisphaerae bacterium RAS1]